MGSVAASVARSSRRRFGASATNERVGGACETATKNDTIGGVSAANLEETAYAFAIES